MSAMETRKIQQVGGGTYTVSLPKEWVVSQSPLEFSSNWLP